MDYIFNYTKNGENVSVTIDENLQWEKKIRQMERVFTDDVFTEYFSGDNYPGKYSNAGTMAEFNNIVRKSMNRTYVGHNKEDGFDEGNDFEKWAFSRTDGELVMFLFWTARSSIFDPGPFEHKGIGKMADSGELGIVLRAIKSKMTDSDAADMGVYG